MFWLRDRIPLYITSSHYHHCANFSEDIEFIKCLSDIFCRVCDWEHILSGIHYSIYGAVCFQFTQLLYDNWENIYKINTLFFFHHQIGSMNYYPLFKVRSWNNGVHRMSLYILKSSCIHIIIQIHGRHGIWNLCDQKHMFGGFCGMCFSRNPFTGNATWNISALYMDVMIGKTIARQCCIQVNVWACCINLLNYAWYAVKNNPGWT